jgi:hypothetical protein
MCGWPKRDSSNGPPAGGFDKLISFFASVNRCPPPEESDKRSWGRKAFPFLTAALLTLSFVTFPPAPPDNGLDSSLSGVLNYVHQQGIQFGPDFAFTYGPLGFLMFFYFSPHLAGLRIGVDLALCLGVAIGLCLVAWRLRPLWRWLLLALFFWIAPSLPTRVDLLFDIGLLCWSVLCLVESGGRLRFCVSVLVLFAAFGALAKLAFLFVAPAVVGFVVCDLLLRGRRRLAIGTVGGFAVAFVLGWLGSGQNLANLGAFLTNGLAVIKAYNGALGWEGLELIRTIELVLAPFVLAMIVLRTLPPFEGDSRWPAARRVLLLVLVSLLTFRAWKYGCVRAGREMFFFGFVTVLAFVLEVLPAPRRAARICSRGLGLLLIVSSLATLEAFSSLKGPELLREPFRAFGENLTWLWSPSEYQRQMNATIAANRLLAQLPRSREVIGRASVDVFGQCQAYALHNDLNYHPRPVFQSYVTCSRPLMEMNERFYLSPAAPEYVLFRLSVIDRKFPPLEDGWVLRTLLANYRPILTEDVRDGQFVLLKARSSTPPITSLVREGTVRPGEPIDLREFGDTDLWMEIFLKPTVLGMVRQALYRLPTVRLAAWREPGGKLMVRNRAPSVMLAAGFLASPLLLNNEDVLNLYANRKVARPGAYSVELLPGEECYWQDTVRYRIYKIETRLGRCLPAESAEQLLKLAAVGQLAAAPAVTGRPSLSAKPTRPRPFNLFRPFRWRPTAPEPGGFEENLAFGLFVAAPVVSFGLLAVFIRQMRRHKGTVGRGRLILGNLLVLLCLVTPLFLAGETYYRFFYDTTDSLAYTRTSERWVQRHWRVNGAGCRDNVEYSPTIAPGKRRITFVGDSFTAGHGIKDVEDRFPNRLRRMHPDWEIHVVANVGLDTGGELELLKKAFARGYQVDEVVLVYCLNDIGDLLPPQADATGRVLAQMDNSGWLTRNSYMVNLWYHHYRASRDPYLGNYCSFVHDAYNGDIWAKQKERLRAFRDLVQAHGGHLAVVTFPFLHALGPNYEYQFIHDKLDRLWEELNVSQLDLLSVFKDLPPGRVTVNPYDAHPNEYANQLAAEAIDKWLQQVAPAASTQR